MIKKLRSNAGETISEVLIASLIAVLGVLLFAMMIMSSYNIITKSDKKMKEVYKAESAAEVQGTPLTGLENVDLSLNGKSLKVDGETSYKVQLFGIEENDDIVSYKKK